MRTIETAARFLCLVEWFAEASEFECSVHLSQLILKEAQYLNDLEFTKVALDSTEGLRSQRKRWSCKFCLEVLKRHFKVQVFLLAILKDWIW